MLKKHWFKELREDIGTFATEAYKAFVNSIDELFIKSIPAAVIKRRFGKLFGIKKISTTPTKQVGKSGKMSYFDKPVYSIPKITKEGIQEFKDYFLDNEKRQQSIYTVLVNDFALESISELMTDKDFMQKLETALADSNITAVEFMESLENLLDPRIKEDTSLDVVDDTTRQKAKEDDTKKEASSTPPPPPPSKIDKEAIEKNEARKKRLKQIKKIEKSAKETVKTITGSELGNIAIQKKGRSLTKFKQYKDKTRKSGFRNVEVARAWSVRDLDSKVPGNNETFEQARDRTINKFLGKNPQWRKAIRDASTHGIDRSFFQTTGMFDKAIAKVKKAINQIISFIKKPYIKLGTSRLVESSLDGIYTKAFKDRQIQGIDDLIDLYKDFAEFIQDNPNDAWVFGEIVADSTDASNSIFRLAAIYGFHPVLENGEINLIDSMVAEHTGPNMSQQRPLAAAMMEGPDAVEAQRSIVKSNLYARWFFKI